MGGPDMAPHTPQTLGTPRGTRGAPRIPSHPLTAPSCRRGEGSEGASVTPSDQTTGAEPPFEP